MSFVNRMSKEINCKIVYYGAGLCGKTANLNYVFAATKPESRGQVFYDASRKLILKGADGIVFVADSQEARAEANIESLENLEQNLNAHNNTLQSMPHIVQYNKRDMPS